MTRKEPKVIVVHETLFQSVLQDVITFGAMLGSIGLGVYLQSNAMQWIFGLMAVLYVLATVDRGLCSNTYTISEARKRLDELEDKFYKTK